MKAKAQFGDRRRKLGLGLIDWESHVKAIQIKWLLNYRDATRGEWKLLLDAWLARHETARGGPFTSVPLKKLIKSTTQRASALPPFWVSALKALRDLPLTQADPRRWSWEDARAHPLWDSPLFTVHSRQLIRTWRQLETSKTGDLYKEDGSEFTEDEILSYFDETFNQSESGAYWILNSLVTRASIIKNWRTILRAIPEALAKALKKITDDTKEEWRYSSTSVAIIKAMGWLGRGLGKEEQGITSPIPNAQPRKRGAGLGSTPKHTLKSGP